MNRFKKILFAATITVAALGEDVNANKEMGGALGLTYAGSFTKIQSQLVEMVGEAVKSPKEGKYKFGNDIGLTGQFYYSLTNDWAVVAGLNGVIGLNKLYKTDKPEVMSFKKRFELNLSVGPRWYINEMFSITPQVLLGLSQYAFNYGKKQSNVKGVTGDLVYNTEKSVKKWIFHGGVGVNGVANVHDYVALHLGLSLKLRGNKDFGKREPDSNLTGVDDKARKSLTYKETNWKASPSLGLNFGVMVRI